MAKIKKVITNGKTAWNVDYRTPEGRRVQKRFPKRAEAEDYLAKVRVATKEEKYGDLFEKKPESRMIFDELADKYAEACQFDKSFKSFKAKIIPIRPVLVAERLKTFPLWILKPSAINGGPGSADVEPNALPPGSTGNSLS